MRMINDSLPSKDWFITKPSLLFSEVFGAVRPLLNSWKPSALQIRTWGLVNKVSGILGSFFESWKLKASHVKRWVMAMIPTYPPQSLTWYAIQPTLLLSKVYGLLGSLSNALKLSAAALRRWGMAMISQYTSHMLSYVRRMITPTARYLQYWVMKALGGIIFISSYVFRTFLWL